MARARSPSSCGMRDSRLGPESGNARSAGGVALSTALDGIRDCDSSTALPAGSEGRAARSGREAMGSALPRLARDAITC